MIKTSITICVLFALAARGELAYAVVTFDWATIGNPNNPPDQLYTGNNPNNLRFGSVAYTYRISKHEVTNDQYRDFLNAVDPTGINPHGVYSVNMGSDPRGGIVFDGAAGIGSKYSTKANMGNKPVNYVSFFDAMRFVNWLENGQPSGGSGTETGVYTISTGFSERRRPGATFFIPSEDEWYKAAYYQPATQGGDPDNYWFYPTATNLAPTVATANTVGDIVNSGKNVANYLMGADWNGQDGNVTTVGSAGTSSASFFGTFDQGGNLSEWNETFIHPSYRGIRGGAWHSFSAGLLAASNRGVGFPDGKTRVVGFRVASIPEPSAGLLHILAMLGIVRRRQK